MFSVTPELYATVSLVSRWLFVFIALLLLSREILTTCIGLLGFEAPSRM